MHYASSKSKERNMGIQEVIKKYKEIGRIMKPRGLLNKRRDDNTFYAYINDDITKNLFRNKSQRISKSL